MRGDATRDVGEEELPDGRLLWRWVGKATRPVVGWILIGIGALAILLGYLGVSREALVAKQLPYLISGGIGGMVFVAVGAFFLGTEDLRKELIRLRRLEEMVQQLHETLLVPTDTAQVVETTPASKQASKPAAQQPAPKPSTQRAATPTAVPSNGAGRLVALAGSSTFHRSDCRMVEGKAVQAVATSSVRRRGLEPCRLCEPALADAS